MPSRTGQTLLQTILRRTQPIGTAAAGQQIALDAQKFGNAPTFLLTRGPHQRRIDGRQTALDLAFGPERFGKFAQEARVAQREIDAG